MSNVIDQTTIRQYAADPMAFFAGTMVPSAHGAVQFGEIMADFQREWFLQITPSLIALARGERPPCNRYFVERTKGGSKDSDVSMTLVWLAMFSPRALTIQLGASDRDQADEPRKIIKDLIRLNPWIASRLDVQNWRVNCDATGSTIDILAADATGSHGSRPEVVFLNELSHIKDEKEEFALTLLDNASKRSSGGLVIIATNAGRLDSWQHRLREMARTSDRWHFSSLARPAPWLPQVEIDEARKRNPESRYQRLYWGKWSLSGEGDCLAPEDIQWAMSQLPGPLPCFNDWHSPFAGACDIGISHDRSAIVVVGQDPSLERVRIVHTKSWTPRDFAGGRVLIEEVKRDLIEIARRFQLSALFIDPWQASLLIEQLRAEGVNAIPMPFTPAYGSIMAKTLLESFRERRVLGFPCPELASDLGAMSLIEKPGGAGFKIVAPRNSRGHCDLGFALSMILPAAFATAQAMKRDEQFPGHFTTERITF